MHFSSHELCEIVKITAVEAQACKDMSKNMWLKLSYCWDQHREAATAADSRTGPWVCEALYPELLQ